MYTVYLLSSLALWEEGFEGLCCVVLILDTGLQICLLQLWKLCKLVLQVLIKHSFCRETIVKKSPVDLTYRTHSSPQTHPTTHSLTHPSIPSLLNSLVCIGMQTEKALRLALQTRLGSAELFISCIKVYTFYFIILVGVWDWGEHFMYCMTRIEPWKLTLISFAAWS